MKKLLMTFAVMAFVGLSAPVIAQSNEVGPYVRGEVGAAIMDNINVNQFYGPVPKGSSLNPDIGVRFDVDIGYTFNPYIAAEFEFGWTYNSIGSATGINVSGASFSNLPFLANIVFQLPLAEGRLIPYIGGGAGGTVGFFDADYISNGLVAISGSDSSIAFAYQGFAGIRYAINQTMSVGVCYKWMGTGNTYYYQGYVYPFGPSGNLGLGTTTTSSIMATFTYRF